MHLRTSEALTRVTQNIERVVVGKRREIEYVLVALLCQGHVLIEDVPGVGKTTLVRSLARSLGCDFRRIQFTPDLLPSDVTGVSVYNQRTGEFEFRPGPVMSQIVLADEINRTSPKTQSALLECMEEGQLTIDGVTRRMPRPFLVLATQNPIEYEGTYPLPEAQLDRFLMKVRIGYPAPDEERAILENHYRGFRAQELEQTGIARVLDADGLLGLRAAHRGVTVESGVLDYINAVVRATREWSSLSVGASPRGAVALLVSAQSLALLRGRNFVVPDDVKDMAKPVLRHRVILRPEAEVEGVQADQVLEQILQSLPVPR